MALREYSDLVKYLSPSATGVPTPVAVIALREASVEFFGRTLAYRYQQPTLSVTANVVDYSFDLPSQTIVAQILRVSYDGKTLQPITQESLFDLYTKWPEEPLGTPQYYMTLNKKNIQLAPIPDTSASAVLRVFVALQPSEDSTGIDEDIFSEWREPIVDGALRRILAYPGRHWTNNELATFHGKKFNQGIQLAAAQVNKGGTRGNFRVVQRGWK